jgi:hypothetical protein
MKVESVVIFEPCFEQAGPRALAVFVVTRSGAVVPTYRPSALAQVSLPAPSADVRSVGVDDSGAHAVGPALPREAPMRTAVFERLATRPAAHCRRVA